MEYLIWDIVAEGSGMGEGGGGEGSGRTGLRLSASDDPLQYPHEQQ